MNQYYSRKDQRRCALNLIALIGLFLATATSFAQTAQPTELSARERLIAKIRLDAQRDAESNRSKYSAGDLVSVYGDDAKAVGLSALEVRDLYEEAYDSRRELLPIYVRYRPSTGWILFFAAIIGFLFRSVWTDTVYPKIKEYNLALFNRLSGYGLFHGRALKKYRDRLEQRLSKFKPAIGKGELELEMKTVYVPLQVLDRETHVGKKPLGALEAISAYRRIMVTGKPGSGKSMLLKSYALSFVEALKQNSSQPRVPVIYELRRHNENDEPLLDQLVVLFEENGFKNSRNFILNNLERGSLLLLFDGLDEVNSGKRVEVVENIKNFLRLYDKCWAVITCRTAVYNSEFNDVVNQSLEIEPFSDRDIQEFLSTWKNMPPQKSATQLYLAINERPKIKELARNPLLLTMIAFLYTSQAFELPYSRAEFYHQAVELLLSLSKLRNQPIKFRAEEKRLVLGHLALFNQNSGALGDQDRISIDLKTVIQEIQKVLPSLGREEADAPLILDEIKEQTGLLMAIDDGTRYQFSHLTLQEYFTAVELQRDEEHLISKYKSDPLAWRETLLLWCGISSDSTELIAKIKSDFPSMAFECLADAKKVRPELASEIINHFKPQLGSSNHGEAITEAFAAVASGPLLRNHEVFDFLVAEMVATTDARRRLAAAKALSLTNKQAAADALAQHSENITELRAILTNMGELALPALTSQAQAGKAGAVSDIGTIGTPKAAVELVQFLWSGIPRLRIEAARCLAELFVRPNVLKELRKHALDSNLRSEGWHAWVWEPFPEPATSSVPCMMSVCVIPNNLSAGRIAASCERLIRC